MAVARSKNRAVELEKNIKEDWATQNKQVSGSGESGSLAVSPALADIYPMPG